MANDITVSIGVDDSALSQAIAKFKASMTELDAKAVALGKSISQGFAKMGISQAAGFKLAGPEAQSALAQYWASMEKGEVATKKLTAATKELGQAGRQTGIDFGAMLERMAFRMAVFEALRLAIQGVKYAFDQISNLQQANIQFDATSSSVSALVTNFKSLQLEQKAALEPDIGKLVQIKNVLEDFGMSERKAILETQDLSQWSKILGVDAVKLAEALGRVSKGEGSLQDMRLVTHMMGEQSEAGRALIQTYVDLQKELKNLEMENATVEKSMDAVRRATKQMVDDAERQTDRQMGLIEKLAAGEAKKAAGPRPSFAMPGFAPGAIAAATEEAPDIIGRALRFGGTVGGMQVPAEAMAQYQRGIEEIARLEGTTTEIVKGQARAKILGYQDVMQAGREAIDDEMRGLDRIAEANRANAEFQKTKKEAAVSGAKAEITTGLPQAVTAPPPERWKEFTDSLKGQGLLTKEQFDSGIVQLVTELGKVQTASNGTTAAVGDLQLLFTSG